TTPAGQSLATPVLPGTRLAEIRESSLPETGMKVNPSRESAVSLLDSAISRDKFTADFQSSLDTARENLARQRKQQDIEADAMHQAMSSAHQVLEDYIRKGPIAHLRERLLEE